MCTYTFSQLTEEAIHAFVSLHESEGTLEEWQKMQIPLTEDEHRRLEDIRATLRHHQLLAMNEATLWSRAIYPLLVLAEQGHVRAWSGVSLKAAYPTFALEGEVDGALAPSIGWRIRPPYLIVHEAKRGLNAPDPLYQLYGEMLAAARINQEGRAGKPERQSIDVTDEQEIFGCYTVNETWVFVRGIVGDMESDKPTFAVEFAPTYSCISDAEQIVQLLKFIVAKQLALGATHANR